MDIELQPVDQFVREGFSSQLSKQFRSPAVFTSSPDKARNLQTVLGGNPVTYPYMFLYVTSIAVNPDAFPNMQLARQGLPVRINTDNQQAQLVRLIPTNFEVEVTYVTNKYSGTQLGSVEAYLRRWLFARRNGSLHFNIDYGMTRLSISSTLSDSVTIPQRENPTDAESVYQIVSTATVHGYVSEPMLATRGIVNQIQLTDVHPTAGISGAQFFPF